MYVIPLGVDSETKNGKPITFQWYSEAPGIRSTIQWIKNPKHATKYFFDYLDSLPSTRDRHYIVFGHNLSFDMVSFFYDRHHRLREESIEGETWFGWKVDIVYAHVRFATFKKGHKTVTLIDTFAYFVRSLAKLGAMVRPDLPKLAMPKGLGQRNFKPSDKNFCRYAMRDSEIAYHVGLQILEVHRELDVSISVSAPHFASKVFKKSFLKKTIPLPPRKIVYAALSSYHGGKNNITVKTGLYKGVHLLDIKSAYPHAMATFPSFSNPDLYKALSGKGHPDGYLPPFGIYRVSGRLRDCKWPILYDHGFKPISGDFGGIWVTGFELNEALRSKELRIKELYGYFYDSENDNEPSPFKAYVEEFFNRKDTAKEKIKREFWKLLLNALYGKFIQTRASGISDLTFDLDENKIISDSQVTAGGLFNPFIASLITGHCRAHLHKMEHKYRALHSSTDGIQTQTKPREIAGLGGESLETPRGVHCWSLILRNKLYIIYRPTTADDRAEIRKAKREKRESEIRLSTIYKGKTIHKYALHGFHGSVETLERLYANNEREYTYVKVNKLKESLRRKLAVNDFVKTNATMKLPGDDPK